ncbi:MAG: hypothetical protein Q8N16_02265 [bacterium]|nr:hypothetical protein [bacterium]
MVNLVYKKADVSAKRNDFLSRTGLMIFAEIFQYLGYLVMVPVIIFYAFLISVVLILFQELVFGGTLTPLFSIINVFFRVPNSFEIDKRTVLIIYGWLSLTLYMLGSFINRILRVKFNFTFKKKIEIILAINIFLALPSFFISFVLGGLWDNIALNLLAAFLICFVGTIYILFAVAVSAVIKRIADFLYSKPEV